MSSSLFLNRWTVPPNLRRNQDIFAFIQTSLRLFLSGNRRSIRRALSHYYGQEIDISTDDHRLSRSTTGVWLSLATYNTDDSKSLLFSNTPISAILPPLIGSEGVSLIPITASDFPALFQESAATSRGHLVSIFLLLGSEQDPNPVLKILWITYPVNRLEM